VHTKRNPFLLLASYLQAAQPSSEPQSAATAAPAHSSSASAARAVRAMMALL
jgi:hypothetical protein